MTMWLKAGASLRKALEALGVATGGTTGAWTDFTPTLAQGGAVACTVTFARYTIVGKTANVRIRLVSTAAGTAPNNIIIGAIPAVIALRNTGDWSYPVGVGSILDVGLALYVGAAIATTSSTIKLLAHNTGDYIGSDPNFALANTDQIGINLSYEIA